ncbi:hypothetical protein [Glycomyces tenuis]|uniref:hypothetical protein n=1 Tax=Glycomyces tenuis TaxID=58116 RepID=UPI00040FAD13|nr:hypothetical protein [Glycomyces tenuis]
MTDFYFNQVPKRPSFWKRLFGRGGESAYDPPVFSAPAHTEEPEPAPEPEPSPVPQPPPPASRSFHFSLPSEKSQLTFRCAVNISFEPLRPGGELHNPETAIKQDVYGIVCRISSRLSLTEHEQLSYRITAELLQRRSLPSAGLAYWGRCISVEAKASELELVRGLEQRRLAWESEQQEEWMLRRRIKSLSQIFDDPRIATIWWFAQHPDRLEDLPLKAQLFSDLDHWFNARRWQAPNRPQEPEQVSTEPEEGLFDEPDEHLVFDEEPMPDPTAATDGQLLDQFLLDSDEAGRAAVGIVLAKLYRDNGRDDLADRVQQYAQPSTPTNHAHRSDLGESEPPGPIAL